jgi:hypothetical protein
MPKNETEKHQEGVRLLRQWKAENRRTADEVATLLGYASPDSFYRICRYEYLPGLEACGKIAQIIGRERAWVLDHWASEVERRKKLRRKAAAA